jgi:hypothetical protein
MMTNRRTGMEVLVRCGSRRPRWRRGAPCQSSRLPYLAVHSSERLRPDPLRWAQIDCQISTQRGRRQQPLDDLEIAPRTAVGFGLEVSLPVRSGRSFSGQAAVRISPEGRGAWSCGSQPRRALASLVRRPARPPRGQRPDSHARSRCEIRRVPAMESAVRCP